MQLRALRERAYEIEQQVRWLWPDLRHLSSRRDVYLYIKKQKAELAHLHDQGAAIDDSGRASLPYLRARARQMLSIVKLKLCYPIHDEEASIVLDGTRLSLLDIDPWQWLSIEEDRRRRQAATHILLTWAQVTTSDVEMITREAQAYYSSVTAGEAAEASLEYDTIILNMVFGSDKS